MKKIKKISILALLGTCLALASCNSKSKTPTKTNTWVRPTTAETTNVSPITTVTTPVTTTQAVDDGSYEFTFSNHVINDIIVNGKIFDEIVIPDEINGETVKTVSSDVFYKLSHISGLKIKKLVIGKNVEFISYTYGMPGVETVEIDSENPNFKIVNNNYITSLNGKSLYRAFNVTEINIPEGVETLEDGCFRGLGLKTLNIPGTIKWINGDITGGSLTSVTLNDGLQTLGRYAFSSDKLDELVIPASVRNIAAAMGNNIKKYVVAERNSKYDSRNDCGCVIWTEINRLEKAGLNYSIPSTVTDIGSGAFSYRYGYGSITIPSTVKTIDDNAFMMCYDAQRIDLPSDIVLRSNGNPINSLSYFIEGCYNLKSFIIPDTITTLNTSTSFYGDSKLEDLYIPAITSIYKDVFCYATGLKHLFINLTKTEWEALGYIDESNILENVTLYFKASSKALVDSGTDKLFYRNGKSFYTKDGTFNL